MSEAQRPTTSGGKPRQESFEAAPDSTATGWVGWVFFGGTMMILLGSFQVIEGLTALFRHTYYAVRSDGLLLVTNYAAWGWVHLLLGVLVVATGFGVMVGQTWARVIGVGLACLSAVLNLAFVSAYPVWSTIVIAVDVIVIYALAVHGRELKTAESSSYQ
jgi:hypothetical protein